MKVLGDARSIARSGGRLGVRFLQQPARIEGYLGPVPGIRSEPSRFPEKELGRRFQARRNSLTGLRPWATTPPTPTALANTLAYL
jgi:hypothetical protein